MGWFSSYSGPDPSGGVDLSTGVATQQPTANEAFANYFQVGDDVATGVGTPFAAGELGGIPEGAADNVFQWPSGTSEVIRERAAAGIPTSRSADEESPSMIERFSQFFKSGVDLAGRAILDRSGGQQRGPSATLSDRVRAGSTASYNAGGQLGTITRALPGWAWLGLVGVGLVVVAGRTK